MRILLLLVLLKSVFSDRLRYHLENLVDRNISACDDFFHHACSQSADPDQFFSSQIRNVYRDATQRLLPAALRNSPIEYDLNLVREYEYRLEDNDYANLARQRCSTTLACYAEDQLFYGQHVQQLSSEPPRYTSIVSTDSLDETISNYINDTSVMIEKLIEHGKNEHQLTYNAYAAIALHNQLQSRIAMIEFMKSNSTYGDLHEIMDISKTMKDMMISNINESRWLHGDEITNFIREKIMERVDKIRVYHDFDEVDKNATIMLRLNRNLNSYYFAERRNTGVLPLDTMLGLDSAYEKLELDDEETSMFLTRMRKNFEENAIFQSDRNMALILAPYMYGPAQYSEIIKEPIILYGTLGHELYHSLFSPSFKVLIDLYAHRAECIQTHYREACSKFGMGACSSGRHTINEDAPDIEGVRMTHAIIHQRYSEEELNEAIDGLETTLDQAFFYYAASEFCSISVEERSDGDAAWDPHSANNVRVNAMFSLMPEFSRAFQCKEGDRMFIEDGKSCYVFGPKSHSEPPPPPRFL